MWIKIKHADRRGGRKYYCEARFIFLYKMDSAFNKTTSLSWFYYKTYKYLTIPAEPNALSVLRLSSFTLSSDWFQFMTMKMDL